MEEFGLIRVGMLADGFLLVVRNDVPEVEHELPEPVVCEA